MTDSLLYSPLGSIHAKTNTKNNYKQYPLEAFQKEDLETFVKLRHEVLSTSSSLSALREFYRWKFFENPAGSAVGAVAKEGKKIIGSFFGIPGRIKVGDKIKAIHYSSELMTGLNYRKQYVSDQVTAHLNSLLSAIDRNYILIGLSHRFTIKYHLRDFLRDEGRMIQLKIERIILPIKIETFAVSFKEKFAGCLLRSRSSEFEMRKRDQLPDDYDLFWQEACRIRPVMIVRDRAFIEWRYFKIPHRRYEFYEFRKSGKLVGYIILNYRKKYIELADYFFIRDPEMEHWAMVQIRKTMPLLRSRTVRFLDIHRDLDLGDANQTRKLIDDYFYVAGFYHPYNRNTEVIEELKEPNDWHLTLGDITFA